MRRDVQLFLGKEVLEPESTGDELVSNEGLDTDIEWNKTNQSIISGGKATLSMISDSDNGVDQAIPSIKEGGRYIVRVEDIEYPDRKLVVNRVRSSQVFNVSVWADRYATIGLPNSLAPDGTSTGTLITSTSASRIMYLRQSIDFVDSQSQVHSAYFKYTDTAEVNFGTGGVGMNVFNILTGTVVSTGTYYSDVKIEEAGNGWYRCSGVFSVVGSSGTANITTSTSSLGSFEFWGVQVEWGSELSLYLNNTSSTIAYYDYTNIIEQPRSNYLLQSRNITSSATWNVISSTSAANSESYFGDDTGSYLSDSSTTSNGYIFQNASIYTGNVGDYVASFYIKGDSATHVNCRFTEIVPSGGSNRYAHQTYNLSTGALTDTSDAGSFVRFRKFEDLTHGWVKVTVGFDITSPWSQVQVLINPRLTTGSFWGSKGVMGIASAYVSAPMIEKNTNEGQYWATTTTAHEGNVIGNKLYISDNMSGSSGLQNPVPLTSDTSAVTFEYTAEVISGYIRAGMRNKSTVPATAEVSVGRISVIEKTPARYVTKQYALDMFDFESINIVDKIKDVRDVSKVFTEYSQRFTVPASANNNEVFDHFYNEDVVSGFDHRLKHSALIKIGGVDYKHGQLTLLASSMKNNKPYNYSVVFYGETVKLKDLLGDSKLDSLNGTFLDNISFEYNTSNVFDLMTKGMNFDSSDNLVLNTDNDQGDPTPDLFIPFISCDSHYFYDAIKQPQVKDRVASRNVKHDPNDAANFSVFLTNGSKSEYSYPLFSSSALANDYDANNGGSGTSSSATFTDDETGSTWYKPTNGFVNDSVTVPKRGVYFKDLKLAIKVKYIIRAIEEKYGIKFSNDFFSENVEAYNELSLFLHREKGGISDQLQESSHSFKLSELEQSSEGDIRATGRYGAFTTGWDNDYLGGLNVSSHMGTYVVGSRANGAHAFSTRITYKVIPVGTGEYTVEIKDKGSGSNGGSNYKWTGTGEHEISHVFRDGTQATGEFDSNNWVKYFYVKPEFIVKTSSGISSYSIEEFKLEQVKCPYNRRFTRAADDWSIDGGNTTYDYASGSTTFVDSGVEISTQMPSIKIMDFLTSLFNMFNLTAYFVPKTSMSPFAGQIRVRPLDAYYISGQKVDISAYVDTESTNISRNKLYSEVDYLYGEHKTIAAIKQNERTGDVFGSEMMRNLNSNINTPLAFDGGKYDVKVKFEKVMYERMTDQSDSKTVLPIQWGWMASETENPIVGKPLLFYPIFQEVDGYTDEQGETVELSFDKSVYVDRIANHQLHDSFSTYIRPSNSLIDNGASLNFGSEFDEWYVWEGAGSNENSLFNMYHSNYMTSLYDVQSRLITIDTHLPLNIVLKLKLEDIVIINEKHYRINSLKMDISTGKAKLELMNDLAYSRTSLNDVFIEQDFYILTASSGYVRGISVDDPAGNQDTLYRLYSNDVYITEFEGAFVSVADSSLSAGENILTVRKLKNYDNNTVAETGDSNSIIVTI